MTKPIFKLLKNTTIILALLLLTACSREKTTDIPQAKDSKPGMGAHTIDPKEEKLLIKQAYENIKIITKVKADTSPLKKALAQDALKTMTEQIEKDLAEGKIKIRNYKNVKLKVRNITKDVAGLTLEFIDQSYYIDKNTRKPLNGAANTPQKIILALSKRDGRWKIIGFYNIQPKSE